MSHTTIKTYGELLIEGLINCRSKKDGMGIINCENGKQYEGMATGFGRPKRMR